MVSKTREKLIEVARQLFVHKGLEHTTMNDIAAASDKGRRTIYTYFKNKREIYNAVIEHESERLIGRMRQIKDDPTMSPEQKLRMYLSERFGVIVEASPRHNYLRQLLGRDARRVNRIRKLALIKETELFTELLHEGVKAGVFDSRQAERLPYLEAIVYHGMDYSSIRGFFDAYGVVSTNVRDQIIDFIVKGIVIKPTAGHDTENELKNSINQN